MYLFIVTTILMVLILFIRPLIEIKNIVFIFVKDFFNVEFYEYDFVETNFVKLSLMNLCILVILIYYSMRL